MAVFTRINGDAAGVVNVDAGRSFANGVVINTGIAAPLAVYKIALTAGSASGSYGNLAAELTTGGAVETLLRWIEANATVLAYQVDAAGGGQLSLITERSGWGSYQNSITDAAALQTYITTSAGTSALGSNIGATGNIWTAGITVTNEGLKLA
jgi:hypothetical protein